MIELKVEKSGVSVTVEGNRLDLLAECSVGFGHVLKGIVGDAPKRLKDELVKGVFECVLQELEREGDEE